MNLFSNIERDFLGPAECNENTFDYYNRSARKDVSTVRNQLEKWFSYLPSSEKKEVRQRFKKSFDSVFYELFLYNFFKKLGFEIIIHPEIIGTDKKPDFLIKRNDFEIYIEAKINKDESNFEESHKKVIERFYAALDKIESPYFIFRIENFNLKFRNQPSTKEITKKIKEKLALLNHEIELKKITNKTFDYFPNFEKIHYENDEISIIIEFLPVNKEAIGKKRRNVGVTPIETFIGGSQESIRESILTKARRYGKFDKPYLICINALSIKSSSFYDIDNVIWGSLAISFSTNPNNRDEKYIRVPDGIFYNNGQKRIKNVSGILINRIFPHDIPSSKYWLFKHPYTENNLDFGKLGLPYCYVEDNNVINKEGNNIGEIFDLKSNWLS